MEALMAKADRERSELGPNNEHRFYNRLFFVHALVFCLTLLVFATIAAFLSRQLEMDRLMQRERSTLSSFVVYYDDKHDEYVHMVFQLYDDMDMYAMLTRLLEEESEPAFLSDPFSRRDITLRLSQLASRDSDVEAILFHSNQSGRLYGYVKRFNTFEQLSAGNPYADILGKPMAGRIPLALQRLEVRSSSEGIQVYGIASSVGTKNIRSQSGKMAILYQADTLHRVFRTYVTTPDRRGLILSDKGDLLFDSSESQVLPAGLAGKLALMDGTVCHIEGEAFHVMVLAHPTRKYNGILLIPAKAYENLALLPGFFILIAAIGISLLSFLLYLLAGRRATHRIRRLETAMEEVGANNLINRIPLEPRGDEFTHIARQFNRMCDELQETINREYVYALRQRGAELRALQARINPHFLYNTLEMVRARILQEGNVEASELISRMAGLFRTATKGEPICSLREEIMLLRMFIDLHAFRHEDRFESEFHVEAEALACGIPRYLLQPLVENYFRHGFDPEREDNLLVLTGSVSEGILALCVDENGRGVRADRLARLQCMLEGTQDAGDSMGLMNVHERIRLLFGQPYGMRLRESDLSGLCIELRLPALDPVDLDKQMGGYSL
jgi:two-component system, sensor histidine kinase YesM